MFYGMANLSANLFKGFKDFKIFQYEKTLK